MRVDVEGNVWCRMCRGDPKEGGVPRYAPNGDMIGKIPLSETCASVCFGGLLHNRMYMCASSSAYALYVITQGAAVP